MGDWPNILRRVARLSRARRPDTTEDEKGFTLIEIVIAISLLVIMMVPFADAYITSFSATTDAHTREVAAMVADSALDQARALDATDQQNGCLLLAGRDATDVANQWTNPAPGTSQLLSETAQASDTSQDCATSASTPLPATAQTKTVGSQSFALNYYVGMCWESENTSSASSNTCTDPSSPPSTDYELYRVIVAVTWSAPRGGCGSSGCDYVTSTLISTTSNPSFDVNPTIPYISETNTTFTIDSAGSYQVSSTGFPPPTYSDKSFGNGACTPSTLPTGVTLSSSGLISGTPPPGSAGNYTICLNATNQDGTGTQTFVLTVVLIPTSMTAAASGPVTYGTSATLSESGLPSGASGIVTFAPTSGGTAYCTAQLPATSCSPSTSPAPGTYQVTATYSGDNTYAGSTSNNVSLTVNPIQTSMSVTVNGSSSPQTINYGSTATLKASVLPIAAPGTVTFSSGGNSVCSATLSSGSASCSTNSLAGGAYVVDATYSPGSVDYSSTTSSNKVNLTVDQAPSITSGNSATFTVGTTGNFQVTANGYPVPAITDSYSGCTTNLPNGVTFSAGAISGTPANGTVNPYAVCLNATNSAGSYTEQFTLTVNGKATTTSASVNPSTVNSGSNDTLSATVTPSAATGTVTFTSGGTTLCSASLSSGSASCSKAISLAGGANSVTATYSGDTTYAGSSGSTTLTVQTIPAITSGNSATFIVGTAGSFQVTANGYPAPTSFSDSSSGSCTSTVPSGLSFARTGASAGLLSGTPANGMVGTYNICLTATNSAGTNNPPFAFTLTVNGKATTTSASVNPSTVNPGSNDTLSATVTPSAATGTVTFTSGGTTLCSASLSSGSASCSTSISLPTGANTVTAAYAGTTTYAGSSGTATLIVAKYTPTVVVSGKLNAASSSITFTATANGSGPTPTGTITWSANRGTCVVANGGALSSGQNSCTISSVSSQHSYTATASYSGDTNYNTASGTSASITG